MYSVLVYVLCVCALRINLCVFTLFLCILCEYFVCASYVCALHLVCVLIVCTLSMSTLYVLCTCPGAIPCACAQVRRLYP